MCTFTNIGWDAQTILDLGFIRDKMDVECRGSPPPSPYDLFLMNVGGTKLKRQEFWNSNVSFMYYLVMVGCLVKIKLWLIS